MRSPFPAAADRKPCPGFPPPSLPPPAASEPGWACRTHRGTTARGRRRYPPCPTRGNQPYRHRRRPNLVHRRFRRHRRDCRAYRRQLLPPPGSVGLAALALAIKLGAPWIKISVADIPASKETVAILEPNMPRLVLRTCLVDFFANGIRKTIVNDFSARFCISSR